MRDSVSLQKDIAEAQATIQLLQNKNTALKARCTTLENERHRKTRENPLAKKQNDYDGNSFLLGFWGIILTIGAILLGAVLFIVMSVIEASSTATIIALSICAAILAIGLILLLWMFILRIKIKSMNTKLTSFNQEIQPLINECRTCEKEIDKNKEIIAKKEALISDCEADLKYLPMAKNHVMIFVAEEGGTSTSFRPIKHNITIDGIDYGAAPMPFKIIELTPGIHAINVTVGLYIGGEPRLYSSGVTQVRVDTNSVFMQYVFKGPGMPFSPMQYHNASDFFKATNQKP